VAADAVGDHVEAAVIVVEERVFVDLTLPPDVGTSHREELHSTQILSWLQVVSLATILR
jgi:hypothetical protein